VRKKHALTRNIMSADNSHQARLERLRNRTLAIFHSRNPTVGEQGSAITADSTRQQRRLGQARLVIQPAEGPAYEVAPCCAASCESPSISNFTIGGFFIPSPPYDTYTLGWDITWTPVPDTNVSITVTDTGGSVTYTSVITGPGAATVYSTLNGDNPTITLTLTSDCGSASASGPAGVCFLAGARVAMADGTEKPIEEVAIGDHVRGAFGEINRVIALHRPLLGANRMCRINDDHESSNHHPHIGANREFYSNDVDWLRETTYNREHEIITESGTERHLLQGVAPSRIQPMVVGVSLKTIDGARPVDMLEVFTLPADTQLYNLVVSGSHTYHVDGYAVTGWPREDDFDYDTWTPRPLL
jgi:hypothetical protein